MKLAGNPWIHLFIVFSLSWNLPVLASEVLPETETKVLVRQHPKTGREYVSIVPSGFEEKNAVVARPDMTRPDYRMLDPTFKDGEIPYDGPYSSSKKVYILAATLATAGIVAGTLGLAAAPAAAGTGAAGGGGAFAAGGAAVATGTAGIVSAKMRLDPGEENYVRTSETVSLEQRSKSFREIIAELDSQPPPA